MNKIILFFFIVVLYGQIANSKLRSSSDKRETPGLIPFPRIGRSSYRPFWKNTERRSMIGIKRREGLIPFPRVGRGSNALWVNPDESQEDGMQEQLRSGGKFGQYYNPTGPINRISQPSYMTNNDAEPYEFIMKPLEEDEDLEIMKKYKLNQNFSEE